MVSSPAHSDTPVAAGPASHAVQAPAAPFYTASSLRPGESLGYLLRKTLASIRSDAETGLQGRGLTFAQCLPLYQISICDDITVAALARGLDTDPPAVTRLLDRLEAKALVVRERSTTDRRVVHVRVTPLGADMARELTPVLADTLNTHLADFSAAEWQQLIGFLQRMLVNGEAARNHSG